MKAMSLRLGLVVLRTSLNLAIVHGFLLAHWSVFAIGWTKRNSTAAFC